MYVHARLECKRLLSYGKSVEEIKEKLENSFYPKNAVDRVINEVSDIQKEKNMSMPNINFPKNL